MSETCYSVRVKSFKRRGSRPGRKIVERMMTTTSTMVMVAIMMMMMMLLLLMMMMMMMMLMIRLSMPKEGIVSMVTW